MSPVKNFSMFDFIKSNSSNTNHTKKEIELIIQEVLKCNKIDLYTNKALIPNKKQLQIILYYIEQINSGKPIQYVLNKSPFYGRDFFINKNVLIPRFDTELIIEILKKNGPYSDLLEIGTGSGNIAITIAKEKLAKNILATDISNKKLSIAKHNKKIICPKSKIKLIVDDFFNSNINEKFDVIVSNPPYIPKNRINGLDASVKNHEPIDALTDGEDGYKFYKQFSKWGKTRLKERGFILLEIGVDNELSKLHDIFSDYRLDVFNDINQIPRVIKIY